MHDIDEKNVEMVGLFSTFSNALVGIEKSIGGNSFYPHSHAVIFLTKLLLHLGVYPERENCTVCGVILNNLNDMYLIAEEGGFACPECMNQIRI